MNRTCVDVHGDAERVDAENATQADRRYAIISDEEEREETNGHPGTHFGNEIRCS